MKVYGALCIKQSLLLNGIILHDPIVLEWIGVVLAFLFGLTMICQGHFIYHQKYGYSRKETEDPEARDRTRRQIEKVLRRNREDDSST